MFNKPKIQNFQSKFLISPPKIENLPLIPSDRKYMTIESIKQTEEYQILKEKIEIADLIFESQNSISFDVFWEKISNFIDRTQDNEFILSILYQFALIRPKEIEFFTQFAIKFSLKLKHSEKDNDIYDSIQQILQTPLSFVDKTPFFDHGLLPMTSYKESPNDQMNKIRNQILIPIVEDDFDKFKQFINDNINFNNEMTIIPYQYDFNLTFISNQSNFSTYFPITLIDFCSYVGSPKCFKFLQTNGCEISKYGNRMAIAGGNIEIIHILESEGQTFDRMFTISSFYHHSSISEWLLSNYECEICDPSYFISCVNYPVFLFLLLNNASLGDNAPLYINSPLNYILTYYNYTNNRDLIKILIKNGADINSNEFMNICNSTSYPLEILCSRKNCNLEMIQDFVENGADASLCNPIAVLCKSNDNIDLTMIDFLISKGANLNKIFEQIQDCNKESKMTILEYLCSAKIPNIELIKHLISKGADVNLGSYNPLVLLCTCENLDFELIKFFIEEAGADINVCDSQGKTPISSLCYQSILNEELIKYFISKGAELNAGSPPPLVILCSRQELNVEFIKYFIEIGADINPVERSGKIGHELKYQTPLTVLCSRETIDSDLIKYFISKGADLNLGYEPPLVHLCNHQPLDIDLIKYFIEKGADINKPAANTGYSFGDFYKNVSPLSLICSKPEINLELIQYFLSKGADINMETDDMSILSIICKNPTITIDIIKYLLNEGVKTTTVTQENYENSPLYKLCEFGNANIEIIKFFVDRNEYNSILGHGLFLHVLCKNPTLNQEAFDYFLQKGESCNVCDDDDDDYYSTLSNLVMNPNSTLDMIRVLINNGADVNGFGKLPFSEKRIYYDRWISPLNIICRNERNDKEGQINLDLMKLLIDKGANVNFGNPTPLFELVSNSNPLNYEAMKLLIDAGADVNDQSANEGYICIPLDYLCTHNPDIEGMKILIDAGSDVNFGSYPPLNELIDHFPDCIEAIALLIDSGADLSETEVPEEILEKVEEFKKNKSKDE